MPLPANRTSWPPPGTEKDYRRISTWDAWYGGDPERLARTYGAVTGWSNRPSQYAGGIVGTIARWFWGRPTPPGEPRANLHLPIASDIAATSAALLFSDPPTFTVRPKTGPQTQTRLEALLERNHAPALLLEAAEVAAALSGVYLRVSWDTLRYDYPLLSAVHADAALPEFAWGRLVAVTFWRAWDTDSTGVVLRHLEHHQPGLVTHALYRGTTTNIGNRVPLQDHPSTASLNATIPTGIPQLTAVYVPNVRPNRCDRVSPLGCSDYAGIEPLMDALDEIYTSWMRDIRIGKGRIIVPDTFLQDLGPGKGAYFDPDREIYSGLNILPQVDGGSSLTVSQFAIRVQEHADSAQAYTQQIVSAAGYSPQTFGLGGEAAITATEVAAREKKSLLTRSKKLRYWQSALVDIVTALLAVDRQIFGTNIQPAAPTVEFPAAVHPDAGHVATTADLLHRAEAASTDTLVRMVHPDWDEATVAAEVERIHSQTTGSLPDLETMFTQPQPRELSAGG